MSVNILDIRLMPPMTVQQAVYIRTAVNVYVKMLKPSDEKDSLLMWLRELDNFLSDKSIFSNLPDQF